MNTFCLSVWSFFALTEVNRSLKHQFPRVRRNVKPCAGINISDNIPEGKICKQWIVLSIDIRYNIIGEY